VIRWRALVAAVALILVVPATVRAQALVFDLSSHLIAITAGFSGTELLLFGATEGEGDVVVILRGPDADMVVRRKSRIAGIWLNTSQMTFTGVPAFYRAASSRPLDEITSLTIRTRHQLGTDNLRLTPPADADAGEIAAFRAGLVRSKERHGLYSNDVGRVNFLGPRLFRTRVTLPANVPPGSYTVEVLLVKNGQVLAAQTTPMFVNKTGVSADVYEFAHSHEAIYGILAIIIAVLAGWGAGAIFRRA
jgi:uncharacterized protein (TIGR02186 family)